MPICARCETELAPDIKVFRQTLCPHCSAYLHACIQCELHDPAAHNQCREPQAEFVGNREKANFCEFFQLAGAGTGGAAGRGAREARAGRAQLARAQLEGLFRKRDAGGDGEEGGGGENSDG